MPRHSTGENNYRVAKGPFFVVIAVIVIAAAIFAWVNLRNSNNASIDAERAQCSKGDFTLTVTTDPAAVGDVQKLVQAYGESKPVLKDFCIRPQITVSGSQEVVDAVAGSAGSAPSDTAANVPGVWVPADISFVRAAEATGKIKVEDPSAWLRPIKGGIAVKEDRAKELEGSTWQDLAKLRIAAAGGSDAALSAMVSDALGGGPEAARMRGEAGGKYTSNTLLTLLTQDTPDFDAVVATEPMLAMAGEGLSLIKPQDAPVLQAPIIAFGSGGPIDEMTARAAEDFSNFASSHGADGPALADSALSAGAEENFKILSAMKTDPFALPPAPGQQGQPGSGSPQSAQAPAPTGSNLLLFDVSDGINAPALVSAAQPEIEAVADAGEGTGARVAVWDYSMRGEAPEGNLRRNVEFIEGNGVDASKAALKGLTSGGQPWMWPALIQAYQYATDAISPDVPNRVVVVTRGGDESGRPAAELLEELRTLVDPARPVKVDVVVLPGGNSSDPLLAEAASMTGGAVHLAADEGEGLRSQIAAAMSS